MQPLTARIHEDLVSHDTYTCSRASILRKPRNHGSPSFCASILLVSPSITVEDWGRKLKSSCSASERRVSIPSRFRWVSITENHENHIPERFQIAKRSVGSTSITNDVREHLVTATRVTRPRCSSFWRSLDFPPISFAQGKRGNLILSENWEKIETTPTREKPDKKEKLAMPSQKRHNTWRLPQAIGTRSNGNEIPYINDCLSGPLPSISARTCWKHVN